MPDIKSLRASTCSKPECGEQIVWLKTAAGKNMPVDARTVEVGDTTFDASRHSSHFRTCEFADQFRSPRNGNTRA